MRVIRLKARLEDDDRVEHLGWLFSSITEDSHGRHINRLSNYP